MKKFLCQFMAAGFVMAKAAVAFVVLGAVSVFGFGFVFFTARYAWLLASRLLGVLQ